MCNHQVYIQQQQFLMSSFKGQPQQPVAEPITIEDSKQELKPAEQPLTHDQQAEDKHQLHLAIYQVMKPQTRLPAGRSIKDPLSRNNWVDWKMNMLDVLTELGLKHCVADLTMLTAVSDGDIREAAQAFGFDVTPARAFMARCQLQCDAAFAFIRRNLTKQVRDQIKHLQSDVPFASQKLWTHLVTQFERTTQGKKINVTEAWANVKWEGRDRLETFLGKVNNLVQELSSVGKAISLEDKWLTILARLPREFDNALPAVENITTNAQVFNAEVESKILAKLYDFQDRLQRRQRHPAVANLASQQQRQKEVCRRFTRGNCSYGDKCRFAHAGNDQKRNNKNKSKKKCSYCNKDGHLQDFCYKKQRDEKRRAQAMIASAEDFAFSTIMRPRTDQDVATLVVRGPSCNACLSTQDQGHLVTCQDCGEFHHVYCNCFTCENVPEFCQELSDHCASFQGSQNSLQRSSLKNSLSDEEQGTISIFSAGNFVKGLTGIDRTVCD